MASWPPVPTELVTRRLVLGPWRADDLDAYAAMIRERDPRSAAAAQGEPSRATLRARMREFQVSQAKSGLGLLVVRVDGAFAGYCGLTVGRASLDEPELAYELLRTHHGNGYATEAAQAVVDAADRTGRSRLWATVRPWNEPSLRVLAKLGFVRTPKITTDEFGDLLWLARALTGC